MKSKIIILILVFASLNVFSQNITNTLGTSGIFRIKDGSSDYLTLDQSTGQVNILKTLRLENTTSSTAGIIYKGTDRFLHNYGTNNTFLGISSGNFTMSGVSNTAFGFQSLQLNTLGSWNTAIGSRSLMVNTTGRNNTAVGEESLSNNISGNDNIAVGFGALFSNISSSYNTAVGTYSMQYNSTGTSNTGVGWESLIVNFTGSNNTALGMETLRSNTSGNENTAVGSQSLHSNTTGAQNTALGFNSLLANSTGFNNTAVGHHSLQNNTGNYNTALGFNAGSTITSGANLICIGIDANPTSPTALDQITLGNGFVSSLRCNVTTITSLSDMRDKKNIKDLSLGLDFITKLKPRQFNWDKREWYDDNKSDGSKMKESPTAGFIAQELDSAQTNANAEWLNLVLKDNPEKWEATPGNLLPIVVKAIQELKAENNILRENNEKLSAEVESLKSMSEKIVKLEQMMNDLNTSNNTSFNETK